MGRELWAVSSKSIPFVAFCCHSLPFFGCHLALGHQIIFLMCKHCSDAMLLLTLQISSRSTKQSNQFGHRVENHLSHCSHKYMLKNAISDGASVLMYVISSAVIVNNGENKCHCNKTVEMIENTRNSSSELHHDPSFGTARRLKTLCYENNNKHGRHSQLCRCDLIFKNAFNRNIANAKVSVKKVCVILFLRAECFQRQQ